MSGKLFTRVHVFIVFWDQVHVMEDKTVKVAVPPGLYKPRVHQAALVECFIPILKEEERKRLKKLLSKETQIARINDTDNLMIIVDDGDDDDDGGGDDDDI